MILQINSVDFLVGVSPKIDPLKTTCLVLISDWIVNDDFDWININTRFLFDF